MLHRSPEDAPLLFSLNLRSWMFEETADFFIVDHVLSPNILSKHTLKLMITECEHE